jgi:hypothetical protein
MAHNIQKFVNHFPIFKVEMAKSGIKECLEGINWGKSYYKTLQIELHQAQLHGKDDEVQDIMRDMVDVKQHITYCQEYMNEITELVDPHIHHLN